MNFEAARYSNVYWAQSGRFRFAVNNPTVTEGRGLPPYCGRRIFPVDEYPACPSHWPRTQGRVDSFFVPVIAGKGLWFDLNQDEQAMNHHVAVVVSVQGINAVTGQPCSHANLEQYRDRCPIHDKPFGHGRTCTDCGYEWPQQNYLATTGTPTGAFWLDGFRSGKGAVSRYVIALDELKGVAKALIGEARVHAIGLSFFLSKSERQRIRSDQRRMISDYGGAMCDYVAPMLSFGGGMKGGGGGMKGIDSAEFMSCVSERSSSLLDTGALRSRSMSNVGESYTKEVSVKKLEVGRGQEVNQVVHDDPQQLDFWQSEPEQVVLINYCSEEDAEKIVSSGRVSQVTKAQGFLTGTPTV